MGPVVSTTVLTMHSKGTAMEKIHDRMPCCISPTMAAKWIANDIYSFDELIEEMQKDAVETMNEQMKHYQVSPDVGNIKNDNKELITDVTENEPSSKQTKIGDFILKDPPKKEGKEITKQEEETSRGKKRKESRGAKKL
eukprot:Gregarina_sp_Poly_1__7510@NODE_4190_length_693_cov_424_234824_g2761_i0_p1_GENE_NODE_4190_length_693_cov_424_234824_g2761_i0NODE_4190_length_693_cov_424_234824_g2761_i0_p1_ORF_typecomplete_len151_score24_55SRAP/PF02586_14/1_2e12Cons_hypoth95/PF03602_15/0_13RGSlike/PF09128_11/0_14_NODE_4190_length_693_cov_424_234824_g2761_i0241657